MFIGYLPEMLNLAFELLGDFSVTAELDSAEGTMRENKRSINYSSRWMDLKISAPSAISIITCQYRGIGMW